MLVAAINAASFFVRSRGLGNLLNQGQGHQGSLGFPFEIWRDGETYDGWMIDYSMFLLNLATGLGVGSLFGLIGIVGRRKFNLWVSEFEAQEKNHAGIKIQFSVKTLLILTTMAAVVFASITAWGSSPQLLAAIYFLGPLTLIAIAMSPDSIPWQHRVAILVVVAVSMIGIAISTGARLGLELDQVLFGIFVSWTPQSAFAAFLIVIGLIVQIWRRPESPIGE